MNPADTVASDLLSRALGANGDSFAKNKSIKASLSNYQEPDLKEVMEFRNHKLAAERAEREFSDPSIAFSDKQIGDDLLSSILGNGHPEDEETMDLSDS